MNENLINNLFDKKFIDSAVDNDEMDFINISNKFYLFTKYYKRSNKLKIQID